MVTGDSTPHPPPWPSPGGAAPPGAPADEPFTRKDVIHIQDPLNLSGKRMEAFDHVRKDLQLEDEAERAAREADPLFGLKSVNEDTQVGWGRVGEWVGGWVGQNPYNDTGSGTQVGCGGVGGGEGSRRRGRPTPCLGSRR